jgi:hypothetical protein
MYLNFIQVNLGFDLGLVMSSSSPTLVGIWASLLVFGPSYGYNAKTCDFNNLFSPNNKYIMKPTKLNSKYKNKYKKKINVKKNLIILNLKI